MQCIKTGCHVFIEQYGEYAYGDAFEIEQDGGPGTLTLIFIFRLAQRSFTPIHSKLHFTIYSIEEWFDKDTDRYSTLISTHTDNHGYEGKEI